MADVFDPSPSVIASWPKPNYVNPVTHGNGLTIACIVLPAIGWVLVATRIYSRLFIIKAPGVDDILITLSLVFGTAVSVLIVVGMVVFKGDRHTWDVPITNFSSARLNAWCCECCYLVATSSVKISILLFYRRLSVKFSRTFLIATWTGITYNIVCLIILLLNLLLVCRPLSAYWLSLDLTWLAEGHTYTCATSGKVISLPLSSVFSVIGDLYSTVLPLCLVYGLHLPLRQKFALYSLFALGFLVVAAGIIRTVLLYQAAEGKDDYAWTMWKVGIWTIIELFLAIFAASAPSLMPLIRKYIIQPIATMGSSARRRGVPSNRHPGAGMLREGGNGAGSVSVDNWSQTDTRPMVRNSMTDDVEKIQASVDLSQDEMEMENYEHGHEYEQSSTNATTSIGLTHPIQKQISSLRGVSSLDLGSTLDRKPSHDDLVTTGCVSEKWILPPIRVSDTDSLRQYRAEIEALPPLPSLQQQEQCRTASKTETERSRDSLHQHQNRLGERRSTEMRDSITISGASSRNSLRHQQKGQHHQSQRSIDSATTACTSNAEIGAARSAVAGVAAPSKPSARHSRHISQRSVRTYQMQARPVQVAGMERAGGEHAESRLDLDSTSEWNEASLYGDDEVAERGHSHDPGHPHRHNKMHTDDSESGTCHNRRTRQMNDSPESSNEELEAIKSKRVANQGDEEVQGSSLSLESFGLPKQSSRDDFQSYYDAAGPSGMVGIAY